jgi:hypothetical protein
MDRGREGDGTATRGTGADRGGRPDPAAEAPPDTARAALRVAAATVLLTVVVLSTALAGRWDPPMTAEYREDPTTWEDPFLDPELEPPPPEPERSPFEDTVPDMPFELGWLWSVAAILVSVGVGWLVLNVVRRHQSRDPAGDPSDGDELAGDAVRLRDGLPDLDELRRGVDDAADHLREHVRPADAVVAAWVVLERAAERSGTARQPSDTPTEFTVAVLDRTEVDPAAIRALLGLYLRARFSEEPVTRDDVATATEAVRRLASGLAIDESEIPRVGPADGTGPGPGDHE